jgi:3',5'-cyclic AMP phosphodiesterase CpdA
MTLERAFAPFALVAGAVVLLDSCSGPPLVTAGAGGSSSGGTQAEGGSTSGSAGMGSAGAELALLGAPLVFAPARRTLGVNAVVGSGEPDLLALYLREAGNSSWSDSFEPTHPAPDVAQWQLTNLEEGARYEYRIESRDQDPPRLMYEGSGTTAKPPGETFDFVILGDTHISPYVTVPGDLYANDYSEYTLLWLADAIQAEEADFLVNLGDMLDFHWFGFNDPPPDGSYTRLGYLNYRRCMKDAIGHAVHFPVVGNWDGENGYYAPEEIAYSRAERLNYVPAPDDQGFPEGGSPDQDYYALTWGDALLVVLNVQSYTEVPLLLDYPMGSPEDWTLGAEQLAWLERTLDASTSKWKFLFIHHAVGGKAGDEANSIYGRGGGLAANVGEQAYVHDLMLQHGVQIFFYGHDHVFTDMVVDGIHYSLPGSAGAPWKFLDVETGYTDYFIDSGFARVEVSPDTVSVDYVSTTGEVLQNYELN